MAQVRLKLLVPFRLITALTDAAKANGCYKVILDCSEANAAFYEKCGLTKKEIQMVRETMKCTKLVV